MKTKPPTEAATAATSEPAAAVRVRILAADVQLHGKAVRQGRFLNVSADQAKALADLGLAELVTTTPGDERPVLVKVLVNGCVINGFMKAVDHQERLPLYEAQAYQAQGLVKIIGI